ncbi:hypothetical protein [Clostridium beijerinckii]|uniref:Uncharacterized protein n=1 Tax=Clostridium beijerinckii TaxID=1520 RepID=A0AAE5H790_CLOBE|nr:hypothetical protein [Clostridium beijerinckii]NSB16491.1 hypothetical protein [Clostridium beijerinckii]OOM25696.1 hypothetical protein CLOBE_34910 [Clostridium beijerinckii]
MAVVNIIEPNITEEENAENLKRVEEVLKKIANEMRMRESKEYSAV